MTQMALKELRKKVKQQLNTADERTLKTIQAILAVQQEEDEAELAFEAEMERRFEEMDRGENCVTLTIDELEHGALSYLEQKRKAG